MKSYIDKVIAAILGIFSVAITTVMFFFILNVIDVRMLKAGYLEGSGISQFFRVFFGIPSFFLLAILWLGFMMFVFNFYNKSENLKELVARFTKITAIQLYLIPVAIVIFLIAFGLSPRMTDFIVMGSAVILGTTSYFVHQRLNISDE